MPKIRHLRALAIWAGWAIGAGPAANAQSPVRWATDTLLQARSALAAAAAGTHVLFAGGYANNPSSQVDLYDVAAGTRSRASLSVPRYGLVAAAAGTKILVAGGYATNDSGALLASNRVDIYDAATGTWTVDSLSQSRAGLAAAGAGTKVLFAGGGSVLDSASSNRVDIYDVVTGTWTVDSLSEPRRLPAAVAVGTKILVAGGEDGTTPSNRVDIYDATTGTWTVDSLSQSRWLMGAAAAGTQAVFAGGSSLGAWPYKPTNRVDRYDAATGLWTVDSLSKGRYGLAGAGAGTQIVFGGGESDDGVSNRVDVYDVTTGAWSVDYLSKSRSSLAAAASGSKIFFGGGETVRPPFSKRIDIYNTAAGAGEGTPRLPVASLTPNPCPRSFAAFILVLEAPSVVRVLDVLGRVVQPERTERSGQVIFLCNHAPPGLYFVNVRSADGVEQTVRALME